MLAKADLKEKARILYKEGLSYKKILARFAEEGTPVSPSSISLWCRDLVPSRIAEANIPNDLGVKALRGRPGEHPYGDYRMFFGGSKGGVRRVQLIHRETGERVTMIYARYLMSVKEGRILRPDEHVLRHEGHSDDLSNLYIKTIAEKKKEYHEKVERECRMCRIRFMPSKPVQVFCSTKCRNAHLRETCKHLPRALTREQVISIRDGIRSERRMNLRFYAKKYEFTECTISSAARGVTFSHLNEICPPITNEESSQFRIKPPRPKVDESLTSEMLFLRRSDPLKWTYAALGIWVGEKIGRKYQAGAVAKLLRISDPSIRALENIKPVKVPVPRKPRAPKQSEFHTLECVICENTFKSENPEAEICWRKECHAITQTENAHSVEMA